MMVEGVGISMLWWEAMRSPVGVYCAALAAATLIAAALLVRTLHRLPPQRAATVRERSCQRTPSPLTARSLVIGHCGRGTCGQTTNATQHPPHRSLAANESGTATIEFALILPVLLVIILLLVQTTLVMGGNIFVHYAAFAAARTAVAQVPAEYDNEPANWYTDARGSRKHEAIHRAAALGLLPVAGPRGEAAHPSPLAVETADGLALMHRRLGQPEPYWVRDRIPGRVSYALENTQVQLFRMHGSDHPAGRHAEPLTGHHVDTRDALAVHVEHQLHLPIPYVNRVFSDGRTPWGGRTMSLQARAMLTNFGLLDRLPEEPQLPRVNVPR